MFFDMDSVFGAEDYDAIKQKKKRSMPSIALEPVTHARSVIHMHVSVINIKLMRVFTCTREA